MIKLEKSDVVTTAIVVAALVAINAFNGATALRHLFSVLLLGGFCVAYFSYINREVEDITDLDTHSQAGNTAFYRYFIGADSRTAAIAGFSAPIAAYRVATATTPTDTMLCLVLVAGIAYCIYALWHEHTRIVDFDEAPFLAAWYRSIVTMLGLSLLAAGGYFAIRYAQWNEYARLPEVLTFGPRNQIEIALLTLGFGALLWWVAGVVSRSAVATAAAEYYGDDTEDGDSANVASADIAALMRAAAADAERNRPRPVRAPGRAFGARVRAGRDPYAAS